jgi:predicted transcriptional regulator
LDAEFDEWDERVLDRLGELFRATHKRDELRHYERIRRLRAPTAKLVYLFLTDHQPQSLATIRHALGVSKSAAIDALNELVKAGLVVRDEEFLYWLA